MEYRIRNWNRFNERSATSNRQNFKWFKFYNTFFGDDSVLALTHSAKLLYIFLLCEASTQSCDRVSLKLNKLGSDLKIRKPQDINKLLAELVEWKLIEEIIGCDANPASAGFLPASSGVTPEKAVLYKSKSKSIYIVSPEGATAGIDFESLYNLYPSRKGGQKKKQALERLSRTIKTQAEFERVSQAIRNYKNHCDQENKTGTEFVMMFASFISCWEEWVEFTPCQPPRRLEIGEA